MKRKILAILTAMAMVLVLTACSGCGGEGTETETATTVTEASTTVSEATTEKQTTAVQTTTQKADERQTTTAYRPVQPATQPTDEPTTAEGGGEEPQTKQQRTTAPAEPETHECAESPTGFHSWKAMCIWTVYDYTTGYICKGCGDLYWSEEEAVDHCSACGGGSTWSTSRIQTSSHSNYGFSPYGDYYDTCEYLCDACEYCGLLK